MSKRVANGLACLLTAIVLASCGGQPTKPPAYAAAGTQSWGRATVTGTKDQLKTYDAKLRQVLGFDDLESHMIGCVAGCDDLVTPAPVTELRYVFSRNNPETLAKFGKAWELTAAASPIPDFALEIKAETTTADCDGPNNPPPCDYMPFCPSDACGRMVSGKPKCTAC